MTVKNFKTNVIAGLCTQEQLDLLNSIDTLRSQGISHYVSLPQIIVCGDQSSGKSSVLEAISGVSFPVKSSLCTRFPTEVVLRKHNEIGVRVSIVPHYSRSEADRESLGQFCEQLDEFDGLPHLIETAKAVMGISTHGKAFSNDLLRVEVSGPDRPHLTIVDLPGLIHSETKQQSAADVQLVQDVVQSYMRQPRSVILAVVSAKNDFANQIVLRLARDADPSGNRTLGVITKPDVLVAGSESEASFVSLAKNQDVEFRLGWHVLKNMDSERGNWELSERDLQEWKFFAQGIWEEMPRSLVGVDTLRIRLSKLLLGQIAAELPSLIEEIHTKINACRAELSQLGEPRETLDAQRSYLLRISLSLQSLVSTAVDGTYNDPFFGDAQTDTGYKKRIRAVLQNLNEEFAEEIGRHGHYYQIDGEAAVSTNQVQISRTEYITKIRELLKRTRGRQLPSTYDPLITRDLFREHSRPWESIARSHISAAWNSAKEFLHHATLHVADDATSKALFENIILPALEQLRGALQKGMEELLIPHQHGHPITYNESFARKLQEIRLGRQREQMRGVLLKHFRVNTLDEHESTYERGSDNLSGLLDSLLQCMAPSMSQFASEEALDCMLAYYQVALKRFVDDIAIEVIEVKLLRVLPLILTPLTAFEMSAETVQRIAGEGEDTKALREQLAQKLHVLRKGSHTCRQFVGLGACLHEQPNHSSVTPGIAGSQSCSETAQEVVFSTENETEVDDRDGTIAPSEAVQSLPEDTESLHVPSPRRKGNKKKSHR